MQNPTLVLKRRHDFSHFAHRRRSLPTSAVALVEPRASEDRAALWLTFDSLMGYGTHRSNSLKGVPISIPRCKHFAVGANPSDLPVSSRKAVQSDRRQAPAPALEPIAT